MTIRVALYSIVFLSLLGLFSCKKDQATNDGHGHTSCSAQTVYITSEIAKFKFKKNSYWVYVDSVSLQVDSTYVDSIIGSGMVTSAVCSLKTEEVYVYQTAPQNPNIGRKDVYGLSGDAFFRDETYEDDYGSALYSDNSGNFHVPVSDSVFIYDRFYKNVETRICPNDNREGGDKCVYYTNSDFGILRKDVFNSNGTLKSKKVLKSKQIIR
jgi:hypothetical protein